MQEVYIALIVIVIVVVIVCIAVFCRRDNKHHHVHVQGMKKGQRAPYKGTKGMPRASRKIAKPNYKVMQGRKREDAPKANRGSATFPRKKVAAGRKVTNASMDLVNIPSIADLFTPTENYMDQFGVSEEQLNQLVEKYKDSRTYKERNLPINRYFSMQSISTADSILRASAAQKHTGAKKGTITADIYKMYGKELSRRRINEPSASTYASMPSDTAHDKIKKMSRGKSSRGSLVDSV